MLVIYTYGSGLENIEKYIFNLLDVTKDSGWTVFQFFNIYFYYNNIVQQVAFLTGHFCSSRLMEF